MPGNRAKWMLRKVLQIAITILKQWRCLEKYGQSYVCRGPNILFIFPGACRRERPYTVAGRSLHVIPIFMLDTAIANRHQTTLHSYKVGLNPKGKPHHKTRRVLSVTFHKKRCLEGRCARCLEDRDCSFDQVNFIFNNQPSWHLHQTVVAFKISSCFLFIYFLLP